MKHLIITAALVALIFALPILADKSNGNELFDDEERFENKVYWCLEHSDHGICGRCCIHHGYSKGQVRPDVSDAEPCHCGKFTGNVGSGKFRP